MNIAGLQKMTLLDYPGKVACTVFLQGCNFRCPFCHNSDLLDGNGPTPIDREELLAFLQKRRGLLDAVCVTGGEPTLQPDLPELLAAIKALGYSVKLDTNGMRPDLLKKLVGDGLVDYVAMDIKNSPDRYAETVGVPRLLLRPIEESAAFLLSGAVNYEFRTTVVAELHDRASIRAIGEWLHRLMPEARPHFFLQPYVDRDSVLVGGLHTPDKADVLDFAEILRPFVASAEIRGMD